MIELAREAGIEVREVPLTKHDVYVADECFLTGTAAEVIPVVKVDSRTIGTGKPGPMTRDLERAVQEADARSDDQNVAAIPKSDVAVFDLTDERCAACNR